MRRIAANRLLLAILPLAVFVSVRAASPPDVKGAKPKANAKTATAHLTYGNAEAISANELKIYDYFLASDQLEGRNLPSRGFDTAALYVASHLAEWGLKPGGSTADTNGPLQPYFMPMELVSKSVIPEETEITVTTPPAAGRGAAGASGATGPRTPQTTTFPYTRDWTTTAGGRGAAPLNPGDISGALVFAGNGYIVNKGKTNQADINPYEGLDAKGKIVVIAGLPPEIAAQQNAGRGRGGASATNPLGENCTDYLTPDEAAAKNGAIAVVSIATFTQLTTMGAGRAATPAPNGPAYTAPKLQATAACPSVPNITAGAALATAIFQGEKRDASQIFYAAGTNTKQDSFALNEAKHLKIHLGVRSEPGHGENVIGILEGSDPVLKKEYVVMSAHLDHIGLAAPQPDGHNINNGADDDGSGSSALLAIAHAWADGAAKGQRPKRTTIFLWNAGEEKGLWGSQYFNEYPPIDLTKVVAGLNIDMIGRDKGPGFTDPDPTHVLVKPGEVFVVGPNISSDDLEKTLETVNDSYQKLSLNHFYDATAPDATHDNLGPQPRGQRIFYRSDHYNFARMGIPIAFFTEGLHPDYHRPTDTPDKLDYDQMVKIAKTVAALGWTLGNQEARPEINSKLPDQLIKDMKTSKDQGWGKITPVLAPLKYEPF